jgi:hypothetical protein
MYSELSRAGKFFLIMVVLTILLTTYYLTYAEKNNKIISIPLELKCLFGEDHCEEGDIDYWVLLHGFLYMSIGILIPDQYLAVIIISVLFEFMQTYMGNGARFIVNPLVNLTGYGVGSLLNHRLKKKSIYEKYCNKYHLHVE